MMEKTELVKGKWYLTNLDMYIKFKNISGSNTIWVSEYITSVGKHRKESGTTSSEIVREANAEDYALHPSMGTYDGEINNYEIF